MAEQKAPYIPQSVEEVQRLLQNLNGNISKTSRDARKRFSCKKTTYPIAGSQRLSVDSWRFQDWDYKRDDLPTYARGLFTGTNEKGQPEITIRGYDKFFNTEEVNATRWRNIENNTRGPYELSLKENGCIIFISGLHDGSLLVCSKHSTGERGDQETSHAQAGERWVDRQLKALGKTRADLARELRSRNATAVAELCDDDFEEHILAYTGKNAGLYLHGINLNIPEFATYPGSQVQAFADAWGFKRTDFLVQDDIGTVQKFLESVAETGSYNGRDVEGFVIRCQSRQNASGPYSDWFFKYKFEEPYLMYRQWRECTKALIAGKPARFKKHIKITEEYLLYARKRLAANPKLAKEYNQNHGIIALRDDFLKEKNLKGSDIIRLEYGAAVNPQDVKSDVVLVPIATIGCGKTTVAIALQRLFDWGVIQNDNVIGKGRPPRFAKLVLEELEKTSVVIADRNNAQRHERKQIIEDVHQLNPGARLVALHWVHDHNRLNNIREVTQGRVFSRGDNHQTIQATSEEKKVYGIMEGFINRFEALQPDRQPDDGFDTVIDLDPTQDSRVNLETIISNLYASYPKLFAEKEMPTSDDLDAAINFALSEYRPDLKHDRGGYDKPKGKTVKQQQKFANAAKPPVKKRALEYMSVKMPVSLVSSALEATFATQAPDSAAFFRTLQSTNRVQNEFHVTLMHRASAKDRPDLWVRYSDMHEAAGGAENKLGLCKVLLERVVWDNRIMAVVVRLVDDDWVCVNDVAHITVGTKSPDVKPKESNDLLKRWLELGTDGTGIGEAAVEGRVIIEGVVNGVLSR